MSWLGGRKRLDGNSTYVADNVTRFYAETALGCLHRSITIKQWQKLQHGTSMPLAKALVAYDTFALREGDRDFDNVGVNLSRDFQM